MYSTAPQPRTLVGPNATVLRTCVALALAVVDHGASGAMAWADPRSGLSAAVLTTEPSLCYSDEFNEICDLLVCSDRGGDV